MLRIRWHHAFWTCCLGSSFFPLPSQFHPHSSFLPYPAISPLGCTRSWESTQKNPSTHISCASTSVLCRKVFYIWSEGHLPRPQKIKKSKQVSCRFLQGQWPRFFSITLKGKCNPSYSNIWHSSPVYQLLLKLSLILLTGSNFPQIPYASYFFLVASQSTRAFYNLKQMGAAQNVGKERWRQRRLTMHAFKWCENASGKNMTVLVELVRGGLKHIMY